jgi:phage tail sheath protein FI
MPTYNTPGVWVEEISTMPPSVAQVATAIPAFVGYTEQGSGVARISSLLDYENQFGKAKPSSFKASLGSDGRIAALERTDAASNSFLMYYGLSLYFRNGGGPCYVVSVGNYSATPAVKDFETGLALLEKEDEPTLIVLLDAVNLGKTDYFSLTQAALAQCHKLGDRFSIFDVPADKTSISEFRFGVGNSYLSYGAAYHPYLQTVLNYQYQEDSVQVPGALQWSSGNNGITVSRSGADAAKVKVAVSADATVTTTDFDTAGETGTLAITIPKDATGTEVANAWKNWNKDKAGFSVDVKGNGSDKLAAVSATALTAGLQSLASIKTSNTALYNLVKAELGNTRVTLPPSPAMAGIYARVDGERGVWKAPANVSVSSVIGPVSKISNEEQGGLNVDADSGKSINAIRDFTGKGTLVWGARTLAGNDNEWRYVPVRRLFITIEESTRKASSFAVFEPNDATTWLKVKAMIDSYLYSLWEQGALAGSKPEQAYFVNVGLGKTMTQQDILEGRMIVEIGVAAVRPAEFVILRFSHKMQET